MNRLMLRLRRLENRVGCKYELVPSDLPDEMIEWLFDCSGRSVEKVKRERAKELVPVFKKDSDYELPAQLRERMAVVSRSSESKDA